LAKVPVPGASSIFVNFDPDDRAEQDWRRWVEGVFNSAGCEWERADEAYKTTSPQELLVIPLPWLTSAVKPLSELPDQQSLYRLAASHLALAFPDKAKVLMDCVGRLCQVEFVPTWKR
jgi:hypothetical protein